VLLIAEKGNWLPVDWLAPRDMNLKHGRINHP
jgi:hypothetical protein